MDGYKCFTLKMEDADSFEMLLATAQTTQIVILTLITIRTSNLSVIWEFFTFMGEKSILSQEFEDSHMHTLMCLWSGLLWAMYSTYCPWAPATVFSSENHYTYTISFLFTSLYCYIMLYYTLFHLYYSFAQNEQHTMHPVQVPSDSLTWKPTCTKNTFRHDTKL